MKLYFYSLLFCALLVLFSCVRPEVEPIKGGEAEVVLQASIATVNATNATTRATATAFEVGDEIGLFAVKQGVALASSKNAIDNAKLKVAADLSIKGDPTALYYPNRTDKVDFYSYFPYQSGDATADALGVLVGIRTTQADFSSFKSSDLCYGSIKDVTPTNSAQKITYTHLFAQLKLNFSTYPGCPAIKEVNLLNIKDSASLNLATGALTPKLHTATIEAYKSADNQYISIVPAQTLPNIGVGAGGDGEVVGACLEVVLEDNTTYIYSMPQGVALVASSANTLNLTINNKGKVELNGTPQITAWEDAKAEQSVSQVIDNEFNVLWKLPHKDYAQVTKVEVSVMNPASGKTKFYEVKNLAMGASDAQFARMSFSLQVPYGEGFSYPYCIDEVVFKKASGEVIMSCFIFVAQVVARPGWHTLGIDENNILGITEGVINGWDDFLVSGGLVGGSVENEFFVRIIEPAMDPTKMKVLEMTIDGQLYVWDVTPAVNSNSLVARFDGVKFADRNGKRPLGYPFVIERVEFKDDGGVILAGGDCGIDVRRDGGITLTISNYGISAMALVGSWTDQEIMGGIMGVGVTNSLVVRLIEPMLNFADAQVLKLLIGGVEYKWAVSVKGGSNMFLVELGAVSFPDNLGRAPSGYPYVIDRLEVSTAAGELVAGVACKVDVTRGGVVTLNVAGAGVTSAMASVSGWGGVVSEDAGVDYVGVTTSNLVRLVFCDGLSGRAGDVRRVVLRIGGQDVELGGYTMTTGNPFVAQSVSSVDLIKSGVGVKPTRYPYVIEGVKLLDDSGVELFSSLCGVRVVGSGELTISAMQ